MYATTSTALPLSYSKACDTFRPRIGHGAAIRTGLGGKAFVHFFIPCAMLNSLVRQHISEGRPAGIEHGLGQVGFGQSGGIDVANRDVVKVTHDSMRQLVVKIVTAIGDLGVDSTDAPLFAGSLRRGESLHGVVVEALSFNLFTGGQGSKVLESEVDAQATHWRPGLGRNSCNLNHDIEEPVTARVARKVRAVLDLAFRKGTGMEDAEGIAGKAKGIAFPLQFTPFQWYPTQASLAPVAQIRSLFLRTRLGVLLTHGIYSTRVQAQLFAAPLCQLVQVKTGVPAAAKPQRILLPVVTVIPHEITGPGLLVK